MVDEDTNNQNESSDEAMELETTVDLAEVPGFHVMRDGEHLGTYQTENDAQCFIDQQLGGEASGATIIQGSAA